MATTTRPRPMLLVAALLVAAAGVVVWIDRAPTDRPNVLLLVLDTTRADRFAFEGYARPTTPRLDAFAKDAVVFENAWSPANWTGPAHASLFTGARPEVHGFHGGARMFLAPNLPTLAERFAAAGYGTACFSNNSFVSAEFGLTRGFAKSEPLFSGAGALYVPAHVTHDRAAAWAESEHAAGRPFFLFVNDMEAHMPFATPPADAAQFLRGAPTDAELAQARKFDGRQGLAYMIGRAEIDERTFALYSDLYDAEIHELDRATGALLDRLRDDGLLDSTVVVVVGDHGEFFGEHHAIGHGFGLYRQVLRVPMMVRRRGAFDGGRVVRDVVRLGDVPPTLLEMCGLPALDDIDGKSLLHDVPGRVAVASQPARDVVFLQATSAFPDAPGAAKLAVALRSAFDGARHLIQFEGGRCELYDPAADPDERVDLAAREPSEVERLTKLLGAGSR